MKRSRFGLSFIALAAAGSLALAGCSAGSADGGGESAAGIISVNGTEPQKGLIPADTTEVGGGKVVDALFEGLTYLRR